MVKEVILDVGDVDLWNIGDKCLCEWFYGNVCIIYVFLCEVVWLGIVEFFGEVVDEVCLLGWCFVVYV